MSFLDASAPQLAASSTSFDTIAGQYMGLLSSAEQTAQGSQAFHQGEMSVAYQTAHMRFVEAGRMANVLLQQAAANIGDAGATYAATDSAAASTVLGSTGQLA
jgi:uncharacterized protein YukE